MFFEQSSHIQKSETDENNLFSDNEYGNNSDDVEVPELLEKIVEENPQDIFALKLARIHIP